MEDTYTKALMDLQKSHVWSRFPNFLQLLHKAVGTKEEGNKMMCGLAIYCYKILWAEGTVVFSYFADVGSGIPCRVPTVRQHKQQH